MKRLLAYKSLLKQTGSNIETWIILFLMRPLPNSTLFDDWYDTIGYDETIEQKILTNEHKQELQIVYERFEGELFIENKSIGYREEKGMYDEQRLAHFNMMAQILLKMTNQFFDEK